MSAEKYNPLEIPTANMSNINKTNPDRVEFDIETERREVITSPTRYIDREVIRTQHIPGNLTGYFDWQKGVERFIKGSVATALLVTGASNMDVEAERGSKNEKLVNDKNISLALNTADNETMVRQVQDQVSKIIDVDFMHRFMTRDANGNETFNAGAIILPFSVALSRDRHVKTDIEVHVPYAFARTFKKAVATNPTTEKEMVKKLAEYISSQVQNQITIRGISGKGGTETALVYDRVTDKYYYGNPAVKSVGKSAVNLGEMNISDIVITGKASAELEVAKGEVNKGAASLTDENPANIELGMKRASKLHPLIEAAFQKTNNVSPEELKKISIKAEENNWSSSEVDKVAEISRKILGDKDKKSNLDAAWALVVKLDDNDQNTWKKINENPDFVATIKELLIDQRGVDVKFTTDVKFKETDVLNIALPLPLLLLLLPGLRIERVGGRDIIVRDVVREKIPAVKGIVERKEVVGATRRLFSEKTPENLGKERSFNEVYDSVDLSERAEDTHALLQHMLLEEVGPSLNESTKESLIDYSVIAEKCMEFMHSDTRSNGVKKGSYPTPEDAQRKITEELLEMWEKHDAETYPMKGIDIKTVLNYRDSEQVIYWAKTLAYDFVHLAKNASTPEEFQKLLEEQIQESFETRTAQGNSNRNIFVVSNPV